MRSLVEQGGIWMLGGETMAIRRKGEDYKENNGDLGERRSLRKGRDGAKRGEELQSMEEIKKKRTMKNRRIYFNDNYRGYYNYSYNRVCSFVLCVSLKESLKTPALFDY